MIPTVSIVVPAKNEAEYLPHSLSALVKSIENCSEQVEIILIDNGSTDRTVEIAEEFGCRVIIDETKTISGLRNLGASISQGAYLGFLDADCVVAQTWLSICLQRLQSEQIGIVGTRAVPDFSNATWVENGWFGLVSGSDRPDYPKWIGTSNMLMRKSVFFEAGRFDESLTTAEDVNFCRKVGQNYLIKLVKSIDTIHLRESKTVSQLIRKEIWRGKYSLREALSTGSRSTDWQQHLFFLTNFASLLGIVSGVVYSPRIFLSFMILNLLLPLIMVAKKKAKISSIVQFTHVYLVGYSYIFARTLALIVELYQILLRLVKLQHTQSLN